MRVVRLAALAFLAAACATSTDLHLIDSLPEDLYASPTPAAVGEQRSIVNVWFVAEGRLVPVRRQVIGARTDHETAMADLLVGPTPEESERGLGTAIPSGAELLRMDISDGVATVDLSSEFELSAEQAILVLRLGQIVYTLTDLPRVARVLFEIDGEPVPVVAEDGQVREGPVGREDYAGLA